MIAAFLQTAAPAGPAMKTVDRGDQSNIDERRQVVVRTADEWTKLWREHAFDRAKPAVDLGRDMIVGVFLGSRPTAGFAIEVVGVEPTAGGVVVRYREQAPPRGAMTAQVLTSPYHIVSVPKQPGSVTFEKVQ